MEEQWWELGACRTANPAIFDGVKYRGGRPRKDGYRPSRDWSAANAVCASCPVQPQCLDYALNMPQTAWDDDAFVAGFTPDQMQTLRTRYREMRR